MMYHCKNNYLKSNYGVDIMVVWENDYYKYPEQTIAKAKNFLYR